jgi:hypothetical protein
MSSYYASTTAVEVMDINFAKLPLHKADFGARIIKRHFKRHNGV